MNIKILDPLNDGISAIELISSMGDDLTIVNDARTSFNKVSTKLKDKDIKLIKYLIEHKHYSTLRGVVFKFKVKCPLFLARQWWKHVVASSYTEMQQQWNEQSFRYIEVTDSNEFYIPREFRIQSENNKQATEGVLKEKWNIVAESIYKAECESSFQAYSKLIEIGVGRELARGVLVPAVYTSFTWTISLQAVLHFISLRKGHGAQSEIALYAKAIEQLIEPIVPHTMKIYQELGSI